MANSDAAKTIRTNLINRLNTQLGFEFQPGLLIGGELRPRYETGSVHIAQKERVEPATDENLTIIVRYFPVWDQVRNPDVPMDPVPLEDRADEIQAAVATVQTQLGAWWIRWMRTTYDHEDYAVEMEFQAWQQAYAETGA